MVLSLAPRGFSPGIPVFPSPQKPAFPNSNSTRNQVDEEPLCGCATCKSLFIYFILFNKLLLFKTLKRDKKNYLEQPHMIPFLNEISERKTAFSFKRRKIINFKHEVFARYFNNCFAMNIFIYRDNSYLTGNRGSV